MDLFMMFLLVETNTMSTSAHLVNHCCYHVIYLWLAQDEKVTLVEGFKSFGEWWFEVMLVVECSVSSNKQLLMEEISEVL